MPARTVMHEYVHMLANMNVDTIFTNKVSGRTRAACYPSIIFEVNAAGKLYAEKGTCKPVETM